jgi:hypothetical protein
MSKMVDAYRKALGAKGYPVKSQSGFEMALFDHTKSLVPNIKKKG